MRQPARRPGRPPLTERRRNATRLEVAREAIRLFAAQGVAATSAESIADAAGISTSTLWRYFPSKEECAGPLLHAAHDTLLDCLRDWPRDRPLGDDFAAAAHAAAVASDALPAIGTFARLVQREPALRRVWLDAHHTMEEPFAEAMAARTGHPVRDPRLHAWTAMLVAALRSLLETHAQADAVEEAPDLHQVLREALDLAREGPGALLSPPSSTSRPGRLDGESLESRDEGGSEDPSAL